jgi:glycosyltransferase involved in cell wall biosynthesis
MSPGLAILLTTYASRAAEGRNLGSAGYSYDFVVRQFLPLLRKCGPVAELPPDARAVDHEAERQRGRGLTPIHLCFMPFQHAVLSNSAPNVVVPAWEFPDVPDHEFDGDPQNNWVATANRCAGVIVGGPWTAETFRKAGIHCPIHIVPVPTPAWNFALSPWRRMERVTLESPAIDCTNPMAATRVEADQSGAVRPARPAAEHAGRSGANLRRAMQDLARRTYKQAVRPLIPARLEESLSAAIHAATGAWSRPRRFAVVDRLELSGVVYTSIFNPEDGRKNWDDLLSAFLLALRDCPDATLVLKLVARNRRTARTLETHCARLDIVHRCRVFLISAFLSVEQMRDLARATTYYITSTRAEGNCLPLMDYLAAGRPAISPRHTAISDYFGQDVGFVVESHPEPAAWPQDLQLRFRTTWHRLVWPSLAQEIRRSYEIARNDAAAYGRLSQQARRKMQAWSHPEVIAVRLREAISALIECGNSGIGSDCLAAGLAPRAADTRPASGAATHDGVGDESLDKRVRPAVRRAG